MIYVGIATIEVVVNSCAKLKAKQNSWYQTHLPSIFIIAFFFGLEFLLPCFSHIGQGKLQIPHELGSSSFWIKPFHGFKLYITLLKINLMSH